MVFRAGVLLAIVALSSRTLIECFSRAPAAKSTCLEIAASLFASSGIATTRRPEGSTETEADEARRRRGATRSFGGRGTDGVLK